MEHARRAVGAARCDLRRGRDVPRATRRAEQRKGEMLAFESVGVSPARVGAYAIVAAAVLGVIAAACVASFRGETRVVLSARDRARRRASGGTRLRRSRIAACGSITRASSRARNRTRHRAHPGGAPGRAASAAAILMALLGVALPLVAARNATRSDFAIAGIDYYGSNVHAGAGHGGQALAGGAHDVRARSGAPSTRPSAIVPPHGDRDPAARPKAPSGASRFTAARATSPRKNARRTPGAARRCG